MISIFELLFVVVTILFMQIVGVDFFLEYLHLRINSDAQMQEYLVFILFAMVMPSLYLVFRYGIEPLKSRLPLNAYKIQVLVGGLVLFWLYFLILKLFYYGSANAALGIFQQSLTGFVILVMLSPFMEELLFRGLLFELMNKKWGYKVSLIAISGISALAHTPTSLTSVMDFFIASLIFTVVYAEAGLLIALILHVAVNVFVIYLW